MPTITATIITKNAAADIQACLESLLWVDTIIVLDSGSTDNTLEICRKFSPKVKCSETDWPGFGQQKNRALAQATTDWILSIDADEKITPELQQEILSKIANTDCVAFKIPRLTYFLGRALRHCFNPHGDTPLRLIKNGFGKFTDEIVHEQLIANGKTGVLDNFLLHYPFKGCTDLLNKANFYSTLGAAKLAAKQVHSGIAKTLGHAIWTFVRLYFLKLGFLDGWPGFLIAVSGAEGAFYRYAKLMEQQLKIKNENKLSRFLRHNKTPKE